MPQDSGKDNSVYGKENRRKKRKLALQLGLEYLHERNTINALRVGNTGEGKKWAFEGGSFLPPFETIKKQREEKALIPLLHVCEYEKDV